MIDVYFTVHYRQNNREVLINARCFDTIAQLDNWIYANMLDDNHIFHMSIYSMMGFCNQTNRKVRFFDAYADENLIVARAHLA